MKFIHFKIKIKLKPVNVRDIKSGRVLIFRWENSILSAFCKCRMDGPLECVIKYVLRVGECYGLTIRLTQQNGECIGIKADNLNQWKWNGFIKHCCKNAKMNVPNLGPKLNESQVDKKNVSSPPECIHKNWKFIPIWPHCKIFYIKTACSNVRYHNFSRSEKKKQREMNKPYDCHFTRMKSKNIKRAKKLNCFCYSCLPNAWQDNARAKRLARFYARSGHLLFHFRLKQVLSSLSLNWLFLTIQHARLTLSDLWHIL